MMLQHAVTPAYFLLCLLLGGASGAGYWANLALQLLAIPIIVWSLSAQRKTPIASQARSLLALAAAIMVLGLVHLIPLPPALWTSLPGRGQVAESFVALGLPLPWMPLSLAPYRTVSSFLWLLPALAVLLGILKSGAFRTRWLAWVLVGTCLLSVPLGALQMAGGGSSWYLYQITNYGVGVGFFANANHQATLILAGIPFLAALALSYAGRRQSAQRSSGVLVVFAGLFGILLIGLAVNGSLAGIGLAVPVIGASLLITWLRKRRAPAWLLLPVAVLVSLGLLAALSAPFGNNLTTAEAKSDRLSRHSSFSRTIEAAADFMPVGSGVGTFPLIYPMYEPQEDITRTYMNHAHSDYLELALETGVAGLVLLLLFILWWVRRTIAIWLSAEPDHFARAASIASAAVLAHSVVDYPLRTAAVASVFALCCALMANPRARVARSKREPNSPKTRHLSAD